VYEEFFVPALFQAWTSRVADAARIQEGERVLDVACGTGVLAREVDARVGLHGSVVGLDVNDGMLAVARRTASHIEWRQGKAEALPFENERFDAVVSQFGLMFFEDRLSALREMLRVTRPGGRLAVAVWDMLDHTPGYAAMVALLHELFGQKVANTLRAPFLLGNVGELRMLCEKAGIAHAEITTHSGTARFPSIDAWVRTDIKGWVLADLLDDKQFDLLRTEAEGRLARFRAPDGTVSFAAPAHIIAAVRE
jgi:SAM-dependent methyltransferase